MWVFEEILKFFSLEALDTRLCPASDVSKRKAIMSRAHAESRWRTLEFRFYIVVFIIVVPLMFKAGMEASNETNPNYPRFQHLLSDGWMFGRKVDNSDQQYRFLRSNFWLIWSLMLTHVALRRAITTITGVKRTKFDLYYGCIYLLALHGTNCVRIAVHILAVYLMAKHIKDPKIAKTSIWIYGVSTLFINHASKDMSLHISFLDNGYRGIVARWDVFYNFTLLRMLSFSLDFLERKYTDATSPDTSINLDKDRSFESVPPLQPDLDDKARLTAPIPMEDYSFGNYLSYLSYAPLFIAGPIITFNDYMYQSNYHQAESCSNWKRILMYGARLICCILVMEFLLHYMYVVAVSKTNAWEGNTPFQLSMLGMFNLNIIWLKLLIPWRLFRFWSLLDGIDPPENSIRCMDNNFSAIAFWRAWHRSYNKWVIRYIYIPMGGAGKGSSGLKSRVLNSLVVFSFVAVWHDIELKLLMWGWLVVLFLLPEIFATAYFKRYSQEPWYRHLCASGAVINIWMMMIANLYGFCLGKNGTIALLNALVSTSNGLAYTILSSGVLFVGVQAMFELREAELRRGIDVRF